MSPVCPHCNTIIVCRVCAARGRHVRLNALPALLVAMLAFGGAGCTAPADQVLAPAAVSAAPLPTCAMAMTEPMVLNGTQFYDSGSFEDCGYSWNDAGIVEVGFSAAPNGLMVLVDISRAVATPGNTYDIGSGAVSVATGLYAPCHGVVTWESDVPNWAVSASATCDDGVDVVARWWGHRYVGNE